MTKKKKSEHDKQIEIWSEALYCAMAYVGDKARGGDAAAKQVQLEVLMILDEQEDGKE